MNIRVCLMVLFMLTLVACGTPVSKATPTTMPVPPTALTTPPVSVTTTPIPPPTGTLAPPTSIPNPAYQDLVVGFSQIGAESDWRGANTESIIETAALLGVDLRFSDAQSKQDNQIKALRHFIAEDVDVIALTPMVPVGWEYIFQEVKEAGIPLILVDRRVDGFEEYYVSHLTNDYVEEGRQAGRVMAELMAGQANIVELRGTEGAYPAIERGQGFREVLQAYPKMKIIASGDGDFSHFKAKEVMGRFLITYGNSIDALFTHNDDMAFGAIEAIEEYGLQPGVDIKIISIEDSGSWRRSVYEAMIEGKLNATIESSPEYGPQLFELALKVANGQEVPRQVYVAGDIFPPKNAEGLLPTPTPTPEWTYQDMTVGFVKINDWSSSLWRNVHNASFKETADKLGISLREFGGSHRQENQIAGIRSFIADEEVNVIVLSPIATTGWDSVLQEAKADGKIVILDGWPIDAPENLYVTLVSPNFVEEGRKAGRAMTQLLQDSPQKNVVELAGVEGSSIAGERGQGFREAIRDSGIVITRAKNAGFSATEGKAVMAAFLRESTDIQGVFAQSDEMALGAIEALREAGLKPGVEVKIVSIGASHPAFEAMLAGELNVAVESNPLVAPQVYQAALKVLNGEEIPQWIPAQGSIFHADMNDLAWIAETRWGSLYRSVSDYVEDANGDGLPDTLVVRVTIYAHIAGEHYLRGNLIAQNTIITSAESAATFERTGVGEMELRFDAQDIYEAGLLGPYSVELELLPLGISNEISRGLFDLETSIDAGWFTPKPISFTGQYEDYGTDVDGDGLFEFLAFEVEVDVIQAGDYTFDGILMVCDNENCSRHRGAFSSRSMVHLAPGIQSVILRFYGADISSRRIDGPYAINSWLSWEDSVGPQSHRIECQIERWSPLRYCSTGTYHHTDFNPGATAATLESVPARVTK